MILQSAKVLPNDKIIFEIDKFIYYNRLIKLNYGKCFNLEVNPPSDISVFSRLFELNEDRKEIIKKANKLTARN